MTFWKVWVPFILVVGLLLADELMLSRLYRKSGIRELPEYSRLLEPGFFGAELDETRRKLGIFHHIVLPFLIIGIPLAASLL